MVAFAEFLWRCIVRKQLEKVLAILLGIISAAILLAEATLLPRVDLSLFSILINAVGKQEVLVQVNWSYFNRWKCSCLVHFNTMYVWCTTKSHFKKLYCLGWQIDYGLAAYVHMSIATALWKNAYINFRVALFLF